MFKELFTKQQRYLEYFFTHVKIEECELFVQRMLRCTGTFFFTGVGKSGFIAQKISSTLCSTGTKALFLSPTDALHGDLGKISSQDSVLFLSKSGETEELLHLLPFIRMKGAQVLSVTSSEKSRLAQRADHSLLLPCAQELCCFDLVPTTSTQIQLLFGDALAIALMEAKKFGLNDYAQNHPAGRIGKRSSVKVRDLMMEKEKSPLCYQEFILEEALSDFTSKKCGCLVVVDQEQQLKGIFTDGDLRRALQTQGRKVLQEKIETLMNSTPKAIAAEALAWEALKLMESAAQPITVLPVLGDNREVIGIIKMHDLIQAGI